MYKLFNNPNYTRKFDSTILQLRILNPASPTELRASTGRSASPARGPGGRRRGPRGGAGGPQCQARHTGQAGIAGEAVRCAAEETRP